MRYIRCNKNSDNVDTWICVVRSTLKRYRPSQAVRQSLSEIKTGWVRLEMKHVEELINVTFFLVKHKFLAPRVKNSSKCGSALSICSASEWSQYSNTGTLLKRAETAVTWLHSYSRPAKPTLFRDFSQHPQILP